MIDIKSIIIGAVGGVIALIFRDLYDNTKKRFFGNRARLFIGVSFNNPVGITVGEDTVKLTFKCNIKIQNISSLDAYHIYFLFPKKAAKSNRNHIFKNENISKM